MYFLKEQNYSLAIVKMQVAFQINSASSKWGDIYFKYM